MQIADSFSISQVITLITIKHGTPKLQKNPGDQATNSSKARYYAVLPTSTLNLHLLHMRDIKPIFTLRIHGIQNGLMQTESETNMFPQLPGTDIGLGMTLAMWLRAS